MQAPFDNEQVKELIRLAISEDMGTGDVTTDATIRADAHARANVIARQKGVVAGLPIIDGIISEFTTEANVRLETEDGLEVHPGELLAVIDGPARELLSAERTVLNFLQRLSGIATVTRQYAAAVRGTGARIFDTRKTTPGWRLLEKYAVKIGGGENHRVGLFDQVLIKDNHLTAIAKAGQSLAEVVERIRREYPDICVEVETENLSDVATAVKAGVDIILLDNMTPDELAECADLVRELTGARIRPLLEASGGVTLSTVRNIAESGVDRISVGALTHSATALDIAIEFVEGA